MCLEIMYLIYKYKKDLALNNQQLFICHKTKPNYPLLLYLPFRPSRLFFLLSFLPPFLFIHHNLLISIYLSILSSLSSSRPSRLFFLPTFLPTYISIIICSYLSIYQSILSFSSRHSFYTQPVDSVLLASDLSYTTLSSFVSISGVYRKFLTLFLNRSMCLDRWICTSACRIEQLLRLMTLKRRD